MSRKRQVAANKISQAIQSQTLVKVGHQTCTNACKDGASRRRPADTELWGLAV